MPNVITHCLFGEEIVHSLSDVSMIEIIKKYPKEYNIGQNGPDFLFYYRVFPWKDQSLHEKVMRYGNQVHATSVNDFYKMAFETIQNEKDNDIKEAMLSFIYGHLCHWALDSAVHPFVFYRTNGKTEDTKYYHSRYESMIDTLMVEYIKKDALKNYPTSKYLQYDQKSVKAISNVYLPILEKIYNHKMNEEMIEECLSDFHSVLKLLFSPNNVWFKVIQAAESLVGKKWLFSSHIVMGEKDRTHDVLNLKHQTWCHPCDKSIERNDSFVDLFYKDAKEKALTVLALWNVNNIDEMLKYMNDRSYDTDMGEIKPMVHFDCVYKL